MSHERTMHDELARTLVARIAQRAGRRVRDLIVAYCDDRLVVRGSAESYYVWQLAIAACQESLTEKPDVALDCRFSVEQRPAVRRHGKLQPM